MIWWVMIVCGLLTFAARFPPFLRRFFRTPADAPRLLVVERLRDAAQGNRAALAPREQRQPLVVGVGGA